MTTHSTRRSNLLTTGACALAMAVAGLSFAPLCFAPQCMAQDIHSGDASFPKPDVVVLDWKLTYASAMPRTIAVENEEGAVEWYWYQTYRIENREEEDILFIPKFEIVTNNGDMIRPNFGIEPRVFHAVQTESGNPLLLPHERMPGTIKPGEDFVREGVLIWPVGEKDVDQITIFAAGIFEEIKYVNNPVTGERLLAPQYDPFTGAMIVDQEGEPILAEVELKRSNMKIYEVPGTVEKVQNPDIVLIKDEDVMR